MVQRFYLYFSHLVAALCFTFRSNFCILTRRNNHAWFNVFYISFSFGFIFFVFFISFVLRAFPMLVVADDGVALMLPGTVLLFIIYNFFVFTSRSKFFELTRRNVRM
ncbi:hypothetical protein HanRHA438_Chr01g0046371 [Helianthus annuus]|nr:hypothetical protein HanHA300_Chr01g0037381 [Helianthus annuus]KAJ0628745.1 hypothetical protein HanHA89_Chr01g0039761 [Helianthus annuus]KAJ0785070.1 hypothetical protein HanLR1_Chr01g0038661 [Helianthus annuus]KAJ0950164.1 hypothetical protein HanRHA438_Chr01g0046371 [Helianthus annuus]